MADGPSYTMDSDAVLDFAWDWTQWLAPLETITSSVITASPGITVNSTTNTNYKVTVWLSGATAGKPYTVGNRISTNQGRTDERTITIRATNR